MGELVTKNWYVPASLQDALLLAETLAAAGDLVPKDYRGSKERIFLAVQYGAELGLTPMAALSGISVINGKASVWGDALLGVCQGHRDWGHQEETFEGEPGQDSFKAVCKVWRKGEEKPHVGEFSVAQAKRARTWNGKLQKWETLWEKDTYQSYPRRMLQMRARGFALRDAFADALRGVISREEAEDYPEKMAQAEVIDSKPLSGVAAVKAKLNVDSKPVPPNRPPPDESAANPLDLTPPKEEPPPKKKGKPPPNKGDDVLAYAESAGVHLEYVYNEAQNITGRKITSSRDILTMAEADQEALLLALRSLAGKP